MTIHPDAPATLDIKMKFCRACGCAHPVTEFYTDRCRTDGLTRYCKKADGVRRVERARRSRAKLRDAKAHASAYAFRLAQARSNVQPGESK
jgi:hypothetical protein